MLFLYEEYSWLTNLGYMLLDLLPAMCRKLVFKVIFGMWGGMALLTDAHISGIQGGYL